MPSASAIGLLLALLVGSGGFAIPPPGQTGSFTVLPLSEDGKFLTNLSAPVLAPGSSGVLGFTLRDPLSGPLNGIVLKLEVYAFDASPGGAVMPPPAGDSPVITLGSSTGALAAISVASIGPGGSFASPRDTTVRVAAPGAAPSGTFAIRTSLAFSSGNGSYLLESRGFFSSAAWENATFLTNGSTTLNVTRLGVSGVVPETGVLVRDNPIAPVLYAVLAASLVLAGVGGYLAWRRGPGSSSGTRGPRDPQTAPTALGNRRKSDGD